MISRRALFGFALAPLVAKFAPVRAGMSPQEHMLSWGQAWRGYIEFANYCDEEKLIQELCSRVWDRFLISTLSVRHQTARDLADFLDAKTVKARVEKCFSEFA